MTAEEIVPPEPQLMESLRAVGYTLEAALADLIDNSISAAAQHVHVLFGYDPEDYVAILDDGRGMTESRAREAMRLAGKSAIVQRGSHDLGRFGLGLKTASLSQCREITLITKSLDGSVTGYRWDLDHLLESGDWSLIRLDHSEMRCLPHAAELLNASSGTLVLWRRLDQLRAHAGESPAALDSAMVAAKQHLSLVFHRFLAGEHGASFELSMNRVPIERIDPFLTRHPSTMRSVPESFQIAGAQVTVQGFTLPLMSKLRPADRRKALVAGRMRDSQGFYIYRGMRLVIWGTWFRILPRDELGKLTRVQVDIPNSLDYLWALDIKKSAALPPPEVRTRLKRIAERIGEPSRKVHLYRGRPAPSSDRVTRIWQLIQQGQDFRYEINRSHPLIADLAESMGQAGQQRLTALLTLIECSFPSQDLFNRISQDGVHQENRPDQNWLADLAVTMWDSYKQHNSDHDVFVETISMIEPFNRADDPQKLIREATSSDDRS